MVFFNINVDNINMYFHSLIHGILLKLISDKRWHHGTVILTNKIKLTLEAGIWMKVSTVSI